MMCLLRRSMCVWPRERSIGRWGREEDYSVPGTHIDGIIQGECMRASLTHALGRHSVRRCWDLVRASCVEEQGRPKEEESGTYFGSMARRMTTIRP
jgi:hypothetical protein